MDRAIHQAAVELLAAVGFQAVSFEAVAARAGVARTSIYRRYEDVAALIEGAVNHVLSVPQPLERHSPRESWRSIVRSLRSALVDSGVGLPLLASLIVAEREQPELIELWRERIIQPRVDLIADVLELGSGDALAFGELAFGGLIARYIARGGITEEDADELAELIHTLITRSTVAP